MNKTEAARERLMVALDVSSLGEARRAVERLRGVAGWFKVGSQLFTSAGPAVVEMIKNTSSAKVFVDLKFHDIPATVALAGKAVADLGADLFNVHAMGGARMMETASRQVVDHCAERGRPKPLIIAVTVLTSMSSTDLDGIGITSTPMELALDYAALAKRSGMDGVVASPEEARAIKDKVGKDFVVVTPGVRPSWAGADDQRRIKTPAEAIKNGADYLVVGRPIMKADDPAEAAARIVEEIESAI